MATCDVKIAQAARILNVVGEYYGVKQDDLVGPRRPAALVEARTLSYLLLREAGFTLRQVAEMFGKSDHSTVAHSVGRLRAILRASPRRLAFVEAIAADCGVPLGEKCCECGRPLEAAA